jgi:hypothetical protein
MVRRMSAVLRSSEETIFSFTFWWIGASLVAMKRVPMLTPSQPSASAATRPRASAKPPEAIIGILMTLAAAGSSTRFGTSSSPGWPAHSKPSIEIASTPLPSRPRAVADGGALVDDLDAGRLAAWAMKGLGLLPAVSTILMPLNR